MPRMSAAKTIPVATAQPARGRTEKPSARALAALINNTNKKRWVVQQHVKN